MKRIFIVNPTSGNGKALKVAKIIEEICMSENLEYEIIYTTGPGNATDIAKKYRGELGKYIVYSVGGDGVLNEVVNGIACSDTILSVIPAGTGNDFYKSISPSGRGFFRTIDVGRVNDHYFINIASLGLDAKIANCANELKEKKLPSEMVYYLAILNELIKLDSVKLKIDEQSDFEDFTLLSICNGTYYGGGFPLAPHASLTDGFFDIYQLKKVNRLKLLKLFALLLKQKHENSKTVEYWKTDYLEVESPVPILCNVDGEIIKDCKFVFENIGAGICLLQSDHPKIMELHKNLSKKL